ncbi:MAG: HlyD family efflux transporter periplasmic adaptor subunit [Candidatus Glassbacteria bacterium]|nr:HlyD family efflux transporter periplasmic adaptor subunit [Candidatus Glassbacteria bacterium]
MDRQIEKKFWTARRTIWLGTGGIITLVFLFGFILADYSAKLNIQRERITVSTVIKGPFQEFIPVRGSVVPIKTIYLDAVEGGRVEKLFLEEGSMVEQGDSILQLSNPDLELSVMNQEANLFEQLNDFQNIRISLDQQAITRQNQLIEIEHGLEQAEREFTRNSELMAKDLVAKQDYEQSREDIAYWRKRRDFMIRTLEQDSLYRIGQIAQLETSGERLRMNLEAVKRNLDNLMLSAPVSGQLTLLDAEIGELKSKGQRLGQIDVMSGYMLRASIDEFYIARVKRCQEATCEISGSEYRLVLQKVYPEVREGRFEVDLDFVGEVPPGIRVGQSLQCRLALGGLSEAVLLPRGGFYQSSGGNWVFVVDRSGESAVRRQIRIGRQNMEHYEVLEGLDPGERVVTSSYDNYLQIEKLIIK